MASFSDAVTLLKQTGKEIGEDNCTSMSAAIAYYTLFSLPPLLVILVGIAGAVFGPEAVQQQLTGQVGGVVGEQGAEEIRTMIENAGSFGGGSILGKLLGLLALVFGATGAFAQLQQSLNRAWSVRPDPSESGVKSFLTKRVLSFGMVLVIALLLVVSLAVSALLSGLFAQVEAAIGPVGAAFAWVGEIVVSLGLFTLLFAAIFRVLPDADVAWRDVWVGAFATSLLFIVGKFLIGLYLGRSNPGDAFGAAGSVVVILVWLYYTSLILLAGAEFTQVWSRHYGSRIEPADDAVRVEEEERVVEDDEGPTAEGDRSSAPETEGSDEAVHPYAEPRAPEPRSGLNE
jgi:membrane protein